MVSVVTTAFGADALRALSRIVDQSKATDPFLPVLVVCPSPLVAVAVRRSLGARPHGVAGVTVIGLEELISQSATGGLAAAGKRRASDVEVQLAIRGVLANRPGQFGQVAGHRTTEERLVKLERQLAGVGVDTRANLAKLAQGLAGDALRILDETQTAAPELSFGDEVTDLALEELAPAEGGSPGPIVLYLPEPTTPSEGRVMQALVRRDNTTVVVGLTGEPDIDRKYLGRLAGWSLHARPNSALAPRPAKVIEVADPEDEVRAAVTSISAHAVAGVPLNEMAILYSTADPYVSILTEQLGAAGLPWAGPSTRSLASSVAGRLVQRLLGLTISGLDRVAVVTLVQAAPIVDDDGLIPGSRWDQLTRRAGVTNESQWESRLDTFQRQLHQDYLDGERHPETERFDHSHEVARIQGFVSRLRSDLSFASDSHSWAEWGQWIRSLLHRYLRVDDGWPADEVASFERISALLDDVAKLDTVNADRCPIQSFASTVNTQIEQGAMPGRPMGGGVFVAPINAAVGLSFARVAVVGLAEGIYPRSVREDSLLPDQLRAVTGGMIVPSTTVTDFDERAVAAVLASSRNAPVVTTARGDLRSNRARSWPRSLNRLVDPHFEVCPSHHQILADHGRPASIDALALRSLIQHVDGGDIVHTHPLASQDPVLFQALRRTRRRRDGYLNEFTGKASPALYDPSHRLLSATGLEDYASCPRRYLFGRVIRLREEERPESVGEITPRDRGTLTHAILERFIDEQIEAASVPLPGEPWSDAQEQRLQQITEEEVERAATRGLTGGRVNTTVLLRELGIHMRRFIQSDNGLRAKHGSTPYAVEMGFGFDDEPSEVQLSDGRSIRLRGVVDRVDTTASDGVIVIDYKGGSGRKFTGLDNNPLDGGRRLQLALYTHVVADKLNSTGDPIAIYWLTEKDSLRPVPLEESVEESLDVTISAALDGMSTGVFPGVPGEPVGWPRLTFENCRYCDFDAICPTDRQREWEGIQGDEQLAMVQVLLEGQR